MEDDVKARIEYLEKLIESADKRFDDIRWYAGGTGVFFGIVLAVLGLITVKQNDSIKTQDQTIQSAIDRQNGAIDEFEKKLSGDTKEFTQHSETDLQRQLDLAESGNKDYKGDLEQRNSEKTKQTQDFEDRVTAELALRAGPPILEVVRSDGRPIQPYDTLKAHVIPQRDFNTGAILLDQSGKQLITLTFSTLLRNSGKSPSGVLSLRVYSNDFQFGEESEDEPSYKLATTISAENIPLNKVSGGIPGGPFTLNATWNLGIRNDIPLKPGKYPILMKFYYGGNLVAPAQAMIEVE